MGARMEYTCKARARMNSCLLGSGMPVLKVAAEDEEKEQRNGAGRKQLVCGP